MGNHIVDEMLKKAEEAEANGDKERAEYWLQRATEAEKLIERIKGSK
jgi:hypothetical protein